MKTHAYYLVMLMVMLVAQPIEAQEYREIYDVENFKKVYINVPTRMHIQQQDAESLAIRADEDFLEELDVYIEDEVLYIVSDRKKYVRDEKLHIDMQVIRLEHLEIEGGAKIRFDTPLKTDEFRLDVAGAADIDMELECNKFMADLSGAANMNIWGKAKYAAWDISGTGNIDGERFITEATYLDFSGAGKANVYAAKILKAEVSGIGLVRYDGNPERITKTVSGLGIIKQY